MTDVKQAIANAKGFATELLAAGSLLLEEVRSEPDHFAITLSFPERGSNSINSLAGGRGDREYKTFEVDKNSGEVRSMSIRQIA